jgi:protein gp37
MNRTKIDWCDYSWNPITGCTFNCSWCYARKISMRFVGHFKPTFHKDRLDEPLDVKKPSLIFADSMSDFWDKKVEQEWRDEVYNIMNNTPQHTYFLLTKQPQRIRDIKKIPDNCFVGVSITCFNDRCRIANLLSKDIKHRFVSLEPLLDNIVSDYIYCVDWIILGCVTGIKNGFKPEQETIEKIITECRRLDKPLFIKNNVGWKNEIKQYPEIR